MPGQPAHWSLHAGGALNAHWPLTLSPTALPWMYVAMPDGATSTTVAETAAAEGLLELTRDTWQEYMETAGDKLVIVDFFTDVSCHLRGVVASLQTPVHFLCTWW